MINLKDIKGVFISPKKQYYIGIIKYGTPYFYPRGFHPKIFSFDKIQNGRTRKISVFGYDMSYGFPIIITRHGLGWKDKFNSPRFEWCPAFYIFFFKWQLVIRWTSHNNDDDRYYEMILWYLNYSNKDIKVAEETWEWQSDGKSTWDKKNISYSLKDERDKKLKKLLYDK
jgi:hypothetical protein